MPWFVDPTVQKLLSVSCVSQCLHYFMYTMSETEARWKEKSTLRLSGSKRTQDNGLGCECSLLSETLIRPLVITFLAHLWSLFGWPRICPRLSFLLAASPRFFMFGLQALETLSNNFEWSGSFADGPLKSRWDTFSHGNWNSLFCSEIFRSIWRYWPQD